MVEISPLAPRQSLKTSRTGEIFTKQSCERLRTRFADRVAAREFPMRVHCHFTANTHTTPPCGTCTLVFIEVFRRPTIFCASTPQPDCTAMYCTPSIMYELGTPVTPELVLNSHNSFPVFASS